jgi:signal transduction histidine kinase
MTSVLIVFVISIILCGILAYILGLLWFSDARNRRILSFFLLGIEIIIWTLLNAIAMVTAPEYFQAIYTLRMVMVCIIPFGVSWFILNFTNSALSKKIWVRNLFIIVPLADIILMVTNPLHHAYFTDYAMPMPARGPVFWGHLGMDFLLIIVVFIILIRFIVKGARRNPLLILTGLGLMVPYVINIMYSFNAMPFPHDITPIGFFVTFLLFVYVSYRSHLFTLKTALFSSTMDAIVDPIIICDQNYTIVDVNRKALDLFETITITTGRTKAEDFFSYLKSICKDDDSVEVIDSLTLGRDVDGECTFSITDGNEHTYTVCWRIVSEGEKRTGYIMILTDVSNYRSMIREINKQNNELVELKERAESASNAKSDFLANMSHEIRTPMNAIIGMTTIAKQTEDPEKVHNALEKIDGAATHLLGVINDILDMSKIEADKLELSPVRFNFGEIGKKVGNIINYTLSEKHQVFILEADEKIPRVLIGDEQRISQIITNLLSNAVKFTPEYGTIRLETQLLVEDADECLILVNVSDNGIGIDKEQKKRLFLPFGQAENSTTRKYGGTGLGLAISKRIVQMMNGVIWLESEVGKGTTFSFTIWVGKSKDTEEDVITEEKVFSEDDFEGIFNGFHILLAEDMEINREIVTTLLEPTKIMIDSAENGRKACRMFEQDQDRYDLIFMDVQMPEMDGYEATEYIRSLGTAKAKDIPIIAMTANVFREDIEHCIEAGMNGHIGKPIDLNDVVSILYRYLKPENTKQQNSSN